MTLQSLQTSNIPNLRFDMTGPPPKKICQKKTKPEVLWLNVYGYYRLARQPGWWFQIFFSCTKKLGEDEPILTNIFQIGSFNHQPDNYMTKRYDVLLIGWGNPPTCWGPKSFWIDVDDVALSTGAVWNVSIGKNHGTFSGQIFDGLPIPILVG